jgi:hypothetical protein
MCLNYTREKLKVLPRNVFQYLNCHLQRKVRVWSSRKTLKVEIKRPFARRIVHKEAPRRDYLV